MNADNGVDGGADSGGTPTGGTDLATLLGIDDVQESLDDVATVETVEAVLPPNAAPIERLSSVLVAIGDGPHSGATVDVAKVLADGSDAWIELFHVVDGDEVTADGERLLSAAADRADGIDGVDTWLVEGDSAASAIVEQSAYYDAIVLGAPTSGRVERFVLGSTTTTVRRDADCPVVVVTANGSSPLVGGE